MNIIKKVKLPENSLANDSFYEVNALISAYISSLKPENACNIICSFYPRDEDIYRYLLIKISRDIQRLGIQDCHQTMFNEMLENLESPDFNKKKKFARFLSYFYELCTEARKKQIINKLLNARQKAIRDRAYKLMLRDWSNDYLENVTKTWFKHKDYRCTLLVINKFSLSFLIENFDDIKKEVISTPALSKLLIRVGVHDLKYLDEIKKDDSITYAYVLCKLGKSMSHNEAIKLFNDNRLNERIGLLLWCFGQMGLEKTLKQILKKLGYKI